jgi:hypothetical protein
VDLLIGLNPRSVSGFRSSAESFPHFYIFLFAFLIIFPIRFVPLCLKKSCYPVQKNPCKSSSKKRAKVYLVSFTKGTYISGTRWTQAGFSQMFTSRRNLSKYTKADQISLRNLRNQRQKICRNPVILSKKSLCVLVPLWLTFFVDFSSKIC